MPRRFAILAALCLASFTVAAAELFEQGRWRLPVVLPAEPETGSGTPPRPCSIGASA